MTALALGIDVGTSGVRLAALSPEGALVARSASPMPAPRVAGSTVRQNPAVWRVALEAAFAALDVDRRRIGALAIDATSGTILAADAAGRPLGDALMYNDASGARFAEAIDRVAPGETAARGAASGLARALFLQFARHPPRLLHQADWLNGLLLGAFDLSDESNALKTGYDPVARRWPDWLAAAGLARSLLPRVVSSGSIMGTAGGELARVLGLSTDTRIVAGCTDGCAAFLAAGATRVGDAVSSLGSTLTLKILAERPVFAPEMGIYSHRIGDLWLAGGASNAGGAAVASVFDVPALLRLEPDLDPATDTGQEFYPMLGQGERFPASDPAKRPVMTPRPPDDARYLQGLYESLARIERAGYAALARIGAPEPVRIFAVGGAARSAAFRAIRARILAVPFAEAEHADAAAGVARLALGHLRA